MKRQPFILSACLAALTAQAQAVRDTASTDTLKMDEVVVTHQRQLVRNDIEKLTYDVQHDKSAKSKSTLEILRKVPMVTVDGQDNIRVNGSASFRIYKNGHPDPSFSGSNVNEILKTLPASNIKKIEVITDPGAKYDAEGTDAILNIVLADNSHLQGVAGNVNMRANSYGSYYAGGYLTTQAGKLMLAATYNYGNQNKRQTEFWDETTFSYVRTGERSQDNLHQSTAANIHRSDVSMSYDVDSLNLISASFNGFYYKVDQNAINGLARWDAADNLLYRYNSRTSLPGYSYYDLGGRADYQHKTRLKGETLTLSYMLSASRRHEIRRQEYSEMVNMPVSYSGYSRNARERFTEHTFQIDYVRPFGKQHKVETGLKYILRDNSSSSLMDYDGLVADEENQFSHNTQVEAAYLSYLFNSEKWSARAGLRYEHSYMKAEYPDGSSTDFHRNLNDWVPSASVQYRITDRQSLRLSYSTSIYRPGISYLNPAVISTPTTIFFGNSALGSSRNQNISLNYMLASPKLTLNLTPFCSFSNNSITRLKHEEDGKDVTTYGNQMRKRSFGISAYTQWQAFTGTTLSLNGNIFHRYVSIPLPSLSNSGWTGSAFLSLEQKLPWEISLDASVGGTFGRPIYNVYFWGNRWYNYNFSLTRDFLKGNLSVSLNANMPFTTRVRDTTRTIQGDYTGYDMSWNKCRNFSIRLSWKFGKLKSGVKKAERSIRNDDLVGGMEH